MKGLDLRIINKPLGWHVEIKYKKWYGKTYWKPIVFWRGTSEPFMFPSIESAEKALMQEIRSNIISNSR